jgi:phosphonate transport system ATP-binding protein
MLLKIEKLNKIYPSGCHALKDATFEVKKGEFLVVIGLSGSGKSTLLRCINRLLEPTSGKVIFENEDITHIKGDNIRRVRKKIGMIFQHFNLVPRRSVMTNVLTGSLAENKIWHSILNKFSKEDRLKATEKIDIVGLNGKEKEKIEKLSGGQKQRVAIARALMQNPDLLLADEPVASLDPATSHSIMKYLEKINKELGVTVICNLHFLSLVRQYADRVIALKDGELVFQGLPTDIDENWFREIYGEEAIEVTID